ncbi:MAG: hypothetical protein HKN48_00040 [Flavobacteriaceae bacterium]|nr:hypothetical protein [Flavobacteriaceae bacterium]
MSKFFETANISGDLAKIIKGEKVELPEGFENVDAYEAKLIEDHQKTQTALYKAKLQPEIDQIVEKKIKEQYQLSTLF